MIVVCLKWVDQRPEPDPPGTVGRITEPDARFAGVSAADRAALEWALRCRESWPGTPVAAIVVGPPAAERVLVDALAVGADRAIRIDAPFDTPSRAVARLIAMSVADQLDVPPDPVGRATGSVGSTLVMCGDYSFDRGTGSVPAFVAADLGIAQALGLVGLTIGADGSLEVMRRVDGGRRDRIMIDRPTVLSVEGSTAMLRRAPLRSMLTHRSVDLVVPTVASEPAARDSARPYRPRPRVLAAPSGMDALDRIRALTTSFTTSVHGDPIELEPAAAADQIVAALVRWSYLPGPSDPAPSGSAPRP